MSPSGIVKRHILFNFSVKLMTLFRRFDIYFLVLNTLPESLDKDIIDSSALAIHAKLNILLFLNKFREFRACKLAFLDRYSVYQAYHASK